MRLVLILAIVAVYVVVMVVVARFTALASKPLAERGKRLT